MHCRLSRFIPDPVMMEPDCSNEYHLDGIIIECGRYYYGIRRLPGGYLLRGLERPRTRHTARRTILCHGGRGRAALGNMRLIAHDEITRLLGGAPCMHNKQGFYGSNEAASGAKLTNPGNTNQRQRIELLVNEPQWDHQFIHPICWSNLAHCKGNWINQIPLVGEIHDYRIPEV